VPDLDDIDAVAEAAELRRTIRGLEQRLFKAKAKTAELVEAVERAAKEAALIQGVAPPVPKPKADRRARADVAGMLLCTDWHFGKHTPSFNTEIAAQRIVALADKVDSITEIERAAHPVREMHALLAGDFVENTGIFPGQAYEVDSTTFQQMFAASSATEGLVRRLLATFPVVHVWEQSGNHGRIGKKGDYPRSDNLDLLVYRLARERLRPYETEGRLVWHPASSWFTLVQVGAYKALLVHGDQIKSFGGNVPAFGIARKGNAWATGVLGVEFLDILMGHFHQPLVVPLAKGPGRTFVNPSIESDSAYAQEFVAANGIPGQRLHYVNPRAGRITSEHVVWLDET
jgi:hypothetical protein